MILNHLLEQEQENRVKEAIAALEEEANRQTELNASGEEDSLREDSPKRDFCCP